MKILVIDAQGGGIGKALVSALRESVPEAEITAVGASSAATAAMKKAGAQHSATGENAVVVGCRSADVITGPVGIVIADSLLGEITPAMAAAVGSSAARRVLIPTNQCGNLIVGVTERGINALVQCAVEEIRKLADEQG